jgi:hypothetical protein
MFAALFAALLAVSPNCDLERPSGQPGCTRAAVDAVPINRLQAIGTHNSYKVAIPANEMALIKAADSKAAATLDYSHPGLTIELEQGARQLEIDIYYDPDGGRYATPLMKKAVGGAWQAYDMSPFAKPGMKVMHAQDLDYRASCATLIVCLKEVRAWSKSHPGHIPLLILLNLKDDKMTGVPGATPALPFDTAAMDAADAEIRSVFRESEIITPDKVQGTYPTLREAVAAGAWPKLKAARGKVVFALDAGRAQVATYRGDRKVLEGRVMFVNVEETSPAAGYITLNEPDKYAERIPAAVKAGIMVRTRADADTVEARANDRRRQVAAFNSGAQYVSTDYLRPDPRFGSYEAHLPGGGIARLDPVN